MINRLIGAITLLGVCATLGYRVAATTELWVFTGPWDPRSDSSLRANAARVDVAVTGWIGLDSATARPILPSLYPDTMRLNGARPRRMAIVTSWHESGFHPSAIRLLDRDDAARARTASALAKHAASMHYAGLVLDFEGHTADDVPALLRVIRAIADSAHAHGVATIAVAVPATDTKGYPGKPIAEVADFIMPMLYDEHWSTSGPGAIASPDWVRSALARRIAEVGATRVIAALPTYGYRWSSIERGPAKTMGYADAKRIATQANVALVRDPASRTLRAAKPGQWEIWVSDAELVATLTRQAHEAGVRRTALWRIGTEDPTLWRTLGR